MWFNFDVNEKKLPLTERGNVYHVQQLDGAAPPQLQLKHQQVWMLQHPADEQDLAADGGKTKDAVDQIDTLVMDFAHKLEAFSLDDVTNGTVLYPAELWLFFAFEPDSFGE